MSGRAFPKVVMIKCVSWQAHYCDNHAKFCTACVQSLEMLRDAEDVSSLVAINVHYRIMAITRR
jgi:hypothetical protein